MAYAYLAAFAGADPLRRRLGAAVGLGAPGAGRRPPRPEGPPQRHDAGALPGRPGPRPRRLGARPGGPAAAAALRRAGHLRQQHRDHGAAGQRGAEGQAEPPSARLHRLHGRRPGRARRWPRPPTTRSRWSRASSWRCGSRSPSSRRLARWRLAWPRATRRPRCSASCRGSATAARPSVLAPWSPMEGSATCSATPHLGDHPLRHPRHLLLRRGPRAGLGGRRHGFAVRLRDRGALHHRAGLPGHHAAKASGGSRALGFVITLAAAVALTFVSPPEHPAASSSRPHSRPDDHRYGSAECGHGHRAPDGAACPRGGGGTASRRSR